MTASPSPITVGARRVRAPRRCVAFALLLIAARPLAVASAQEGRIPPEIAKEIAQSSAQVPASELPELAKAAAPEHPVAERYKAYARIARIEPSADHPEREELLLQGLRAEDESLRLQCAQALRRRVPEPRVRAVVAGLTAALDDADPQLVAAAAHSLKTFGPAAEAALPRLGELLHGDPKFEASERALSERASPLGLDFLLEVRTAAAGARAAIGGTDIDIARTGELDSSGREAWVWGMMPLVEGGLSPVVVAAGQATPPSPTLQVRYVELLGLVIQDVAARAENTPPSRPVTYAMSIDAGSRLRSSLEQLVKGLVRFAAFPGTATEAHQYAQILIDRFDHSEIEVLRATWQTVKKANEQVPKAR